MVDELLGEALVNRTEVIFKFIWGFGSFSQ